MTAKETFPNVIDPSVTSFATAVLKAVCVPETSVSMAVILDGHPELRFTLRQCGLKRARVEMKSSVLPSIETGSVRLPSASWRTIDGRRRPA